MRLASPISRSDLVSESVPTVGLETMEGIKKRIYDSEKPTAGNRR
jgi:hypothetical protein